MIIQYYWWIIQCYECPITQIGAGVLGCEQDFTLNFLEFDNRIRIRSPSSLSTIQCYWWIAMSVQRLRTAMCVSSSIIQLVIWLRYCYHHHYGLLSNMLRQTVHEIKEIKTGSLSILSIHTFRNILHTKLEFRLLLLSFDYYHCTAMDHIRQKNHLKSQLFAKIYRFSTLWFPSIHLGG